MIWRKRWRCCLRAGARMVVNDTTIPASLARAELGIACLADIEIAAALAAGALVRVLAAWTPPTPGLFLYVPARSQQQRKLRALIDTAAAVLGNSRGRSRRRLCPQAATCPASKAPQYVSQSRLTCAAIAAAIWAAAPRQRFLAAKASSASTLAEPWRPALRSWARSTKGRPSSITGCRKAAVTA